jgi:peptide deformylase
MSNIEYGLITLKNDKNGFLRKVAELIILEEIPDMQEFINAMIETIYNLGAGGLAAPQLGVSKRIFALNDGMVCINPTIVGRSGKITSHAEGCLSVEDKRYDVKRSREVMIKYLDRSGNLQTLKSRSKMINIAIQHEMDHLNGKLICDHGRLRR